MSAPHQIATNSAVLRDSDPHRARRPITLDHLIGASVKERRQSLGLSQQTLAQRCGLSFQQIQKYEAGTNRIPASRLFDLASALQLSPTELLTAAWKTEQTKRDETWRQRLHQSAARLSGDELHALVVLAERLAAKAA